MWLLPSQPGNPIIIGSGNIIEERSYITSACVCLSPRCACRTPALPPARSRSSSLRPCSAVWLRSNGPVTIGDSNHLQVGSRLESCTLGDGNVVEVNSSIGSGCTLENACVVGALVKVPEGEALPSCTVIFGSNNSSHVLPRPEEEVSSHHRVLPAAASRCCFPCHLRHRAADKMSARVMPVCARGSAADQAHEVSNRQGAGAATQGIQADTGDQDQSAERLTEGHIDRQPQPTAYLPTYLSFYCSLLRS